jgi:hypothetical protein
MIDVEEFPDVYYGNAAETPNIDWRKDDTEEEDDDDDAPTAQDVIDALGFDPQVEFDDEDDTTHDTASAIAYLGHEHDLQIVLEHPRGAVRRGVGWEIQMPYDYGFIRGYVGADGDQLDCCIGEHASDNVFVVNQHDPASGRFDEHKVMLGYTTICEATAAYDAGYNDGTGPLRRNSIATLTMPEFKQWLEENEFSTPCK